MIYPVCGPQTDGSLVVASPCLLPRLAPKSFDTPWHYWAAGLPVPVKQLRQASLMPDHVMPAVELSSTQRANAQKATRRRLKQESVRAFKAVNQTSDATGVWLSPTTKD